MNYKDIFSDKFIMWILVIAFLPFGLCISVYYIRFKYFLGYPISPVQADWGTFGDFVGGVLNPIYAFLAFVGVVYTVLLQKKQIEMMKEQEKLNELQNLIQGQAAKIDETLYGRKFRIKENTEDVADIFNILRAISKISIDAEKEPDGLDAMVYEDERATVLGKISYELIFIEEQIGFLVWCLQTYEKNKGNKDIIDFYCAKYRHAVFMLKQIQHLQVAALEHFFNIAEHKEQMIQ